MRGSRKFGQRGSKFDNFFFVNEGIENLNTTINGLSSDRQRNAIYMAFRWQADDCPTLNAVIFQGIRTSIANKHCIL